MTNIYTDKYFTKSKIVAKEAGLNPVVKYRVFGRFDGIAALEPTKDLINILAPSAKVKVLPTGTPFSAKDTIMTVEGKFQDIVELETMYLWWSALPCYCAKQASEIVKLAEGKQVLDFHARHLYDPTSVALASYGAEIGGIIGFSTDIGANAQDYLYNAATYYGIRSSSGFISGKEGIGTTPHALIALFKGDYIAMADAYRRAFPNDKFIALIDYNNREIDDTLKLVKHLDKNLYGVRIDTCGENVAQQEPFGRETDKGVTVSAVNSLRDALNYNGGEHVKIFVSSGFNEEKTKLFMERAAKSFDGIGTGSFIPKGPTCTADIFEVDGQNETKIGREWGYEANKRFNFLLNTY